MASLIAAGLTCVDRGPLGSGMVPTPEGWKYRIACVQNLYMDSVCGKLALCDIYYVMTTTHFYFVYILLMNIITV